MFSFVTVELPKLIEANFPVIPGRKSVSGHSMGGHGALICALKTGDFVSASAFAPISNPSQCPWGKKAFSGYLGDDKEQWAQWDATELVTSSPHASKLGSILIVRRTRASAPHACRTLA